VAVSSRFLALAPDLSDGAGVVLCNPERTALLAQLRATLPAGSFDAGERGETASETAARLAGAGVLGLRILAGPRDQRAARILRDACAATLDIDIDVEVAAPTTAPATGSTIVLRVPQADSRGELDEWLERCRTACAKHGSQNVRIAPAPLTTVPPCPGRRSPLPKDLGLEDPEWRGALVALVAECWPRSMPPFLACLGAHDLGANQLEDVYAGLGLRERNAELLVNIVDRP
jgi:hypothetical protein